MIVQKVKNFFKPPIIEKAPYTLAFERSTTDEDFFDGGFGTIIAPEEDGDWKFQILNECELKDKSASEMLDILADTSPQINRAVYDMRNNLVTEFTWTPEQEDEEAQRILKNAERTIVANGSSINRKLGELVDSGFLKAHFFVENIFHQGEFAEIKVLDPFRARFEKDKNDRLGEHWNLGQRQQGVFVSFQDNPYIRFVPLLPRAEKPYGRPMAAAALYPVVFLLGLLKAARQSMLLQAFPNRLITIDREHLAKAGYDVDQINKILLDLKGTLGPQLLKTGTGTQLLEGREVQIEMIGGVTRVSYDGLEMMINLLNKMIIQALKLYPINVGDSEGSALSSGNADQQVEQWAVSNDAFMRELESIFSIFGTQILNNYGNANTAVFQMKRNHSIPEKIRAERMKIKIDIIKEATAMGIWTEEEGRRISKEPDALNRLPEILKDDKGFEAQIAERREMSRLAITGPPSEEDNE